MSSAPYFKLYFSDLAGDTLQLSDAEIGSYVLLLGAMWNGGGRLPFDPEKLSRIARVARKAWPKRWSALAPYFIRDGRFITHKRLSAERAKANIVSGVRKEAGARGAKVKALKNKETGLAIASENDKQKPSIPKPYTKAKSSEAKASSLSAASPRRERAKPKVSIPEGYPDDQAQVAAGMAALAAGVTLDIGATAERFRNHALSEGRTSADWSAAWANWVGIEMGKAPQCVQPMAPASLATFPGPPDLRAAAAAIKGEPWTRSWLDPCGWRDLPEPALMARSDLAAERIRREIGDLLDDHGIKIVLERSAA